MSELIFEYEDRDQLARKAGYQSVRRKEYYRGEYQIVPSEQARVRIEKGLDADFSIIRLKSSSPLKFKRNWHHIRSDNLDVSVLWFVERGSIVFSHAGRNDVISSGQCTISRSLQPFRMECMVDDCSDHEVLHVVVPTHLVIDYIPDQLRPGAAFSTRDGDCHLALKTFELLYEEGSGVSQRAADGLAREAFRAIGSLITSGHEARPHSIAERRYEDVLDFILHNLSNPNLSVEMTADGVGISCSYLMHILRARGTSFSDIMWNNRLELARRLLVADTIQNLPIKHIAFRAGFKSAAHFSRMFKCAQDCTPGDFRKVHG